VIDFRIRICPLKVLKVCQVCSPEPVDRLVIITDDKDILSTKESDQFKLGKVRILKLIDQDVRILPAIPGSYLLLLGEGIHRKMNHIIKIDEPVIEFILLISGIY